MMVGVTSTRKNFLNLLIFFSLTIKTKQILNLISFQKEKMKVLVVLVGLAAVLANVEAGGYTAKGGVFDFKKPLDYYEQAVSAGTNPGVSNSK